ncbi:hypothetical protein [Sulfitobacter mediterraneus]|uniref:hypothetical protein n=1 Tax=Sulfitobacter mediterraneus TaxID=83219 RepID=UPI000EA3CEF8|nr:hypothetical protein [Sulfitobacter mediterraneus]
MTRFLLAAMAALILPTGAMAEAYDCETKHFGIGGWVPERIILAYDTEAEVGSAFDAMINHLHKAPIPVDWAARSETSFTFKWKLRGLKATNGGKGINSYRVTLFTSLNKFTLSGQRHGYDNVISASGTRKKIK